MTSYIYALADPRTMQIRYVGKANNVARRLESHLRDSQRRKTPVYSWLRKLSDLGLRPILTTLAVCADNWQERERQVIASMRSAGVKLLNLADGGDEPLCTPENRRKAGMRSVEVRRQQTHECIERLRESARAKPEESAKLERIAREVLVIMPKEYKEAFTWL